VELLSRTVTRLGGNWEAGHLARLEGRFAGVVLVRVAQERSAELLDALTQLEDLRVFVEHSVAQDTLAGYRELRLELVGNDQPGIVHDISRVLAEREVNVGELHTWVTDAPMAGGQLFHLDAVVHCPPALDIDALQDVLEQLAADLMVDLSLDAGEP